MDNPERTMSLMVDRPVPIADTDYAYYGGELLPLDIAIHSWMSYNGRYLVSRSMVEKTYNKLNLRRKLKFINEHRFNLGLHKVEKTDKEIIDELITILES